MMILRYIFAVCLAAGFFVTGVQAQTTVTYPPLVSDVQAHQKAYNRTTGDQPTRVAKKAVSTSPRTSRYAKLLKSQEEENGWKINSKVVTSLGFGLAAVIAIGLAAILGDDDDTSASSTSTTTSTQ